MTCWKMCARRWAEACFGLLLILSCRNTGPQERKQANPAQSGGSQEPRIVEVPQITVTAGEALDPQLQPRGLSLQMTDMGMPQALRHAPIGQGMVTADHHVVLSFPERSQVLKFSAPHFDTSIWGPASLGGNGTPLERPMLVAQFAGAFFVSEQMDGRVWQLDSQGQVVTLHDLGRPPLALGPAGSGVLWVPEDDSLFVRVDGSGRRVQGFHAGSMLEALGLNPRQSLGPLHVDQDWQVLLAPAVPSHLLHYRLPPHLLHIVHLNLAALERSGSAWRVAELRQGRERTWLLLAGAQHSQLLQIDGRGQLIAQWRLPFQADGFDLSSQLLLLYQRATGMAQTYLLP
jgi:hypothetical protein